MSKRRDYIECNQAAYNALAHEYEERIPTYERSDPNLFKAFCAAIDGSFGTAPRILEVGCGSGLDLRILTQKRYSVVGVDLSDKMLEVARRHCPASVLLFGDFLSIPFWRESFEGVVAKASLHNFPKRDALKVLARIRELLVENGVLYVTTTLSERSRQGFVRKSGYRSQVVRYRKLWTEVELLKALTAAGFKLDSRFLTVDASREAEWLNYVVRKGRVVK